MSEASFSIRFRHWLKANPLDYSCTFEMKDTLGKKSLPFKDIKESQLNWAEAIESKNGTLMRQVGGSGEPDYTYHYNQPAFLVINFPDAFHVIRMKDFVKYKDSAKKKSLTSEEARLIAFTSV